MAMLRTKGSSVWECKNPSALSEILPPLKKDLGPISVVESGNSSMPRLSIPWGICPMSCVGWWGCLMRCNITYLERYN